jgi:anti-anti-sigma factor
LEGVEGLIKEGTIESDQLTIDQEGYTLVLRFIGEFDYSSSDITDQAIDAICEVQPVMVIFDLSAASYIDQGGASCFHKIARELDANDIPFALIRPASEDVCRIMDLMGFDHHLAA